MNLIPNSQARPFNRDYDEITQSLCVPEADRYARLIVQYLESMGVNTPIIDRITKRLVASGVLFGVMVVIIIGLAMALKA